MARLAAEYGPQTRRRHAPTAPSKIRIFVTGHAVLPLLRGAGERFWKGRPEGRINAPTLIQNHQLVIEIHHFQCRSLRERSGVTAFLLAPSTKARLLLATPAASRSAAEAPHWVMVLRD